MPQQGIPALRQEAHRARYAVMMLALLLATAAPTFDPMTFFAGRTCGRGELKVVLRRRVAVAVAGTGTVAPDGSLVLDQLITEGSRPPRSRRWILRRVAADRFQGSLTDAKGPVVAEVQGYRLHLRFTTLSGFKVEQRLTLASDGRSADNLLFARKLGVTVARLHERIVKID